MTTVRMRELRLIQRRLLALRVVVVPFMVVQIVTYYIPYPPGTQWPAWMATVILAVATPVVWLGACRAQTEEQATFWAMVGLTIDGFVAMLLVFTYTFDPDTAVWAMLFLIPIEGAIVFQLHGALWALLGISVGYIVREIYGAVALGTPWLPQSISYRLGLAAVMAVSTGLTARGLVEERDRLRQMTAMLDGRSADLSAANAALTEAQRTQSEFVAITNHELRTPLTAIQGFSRTLRLRWDDMTEPSRRSAVEAIDQQSRRLGELVEDVLTVSSMRAGDLAVSPRPLHLRTWLEEALGITEVEAHLHCCPEIMVYSDSKRLLQVLVNLLTNAKKYGEPPCAVVGRTEGDRTVIMICDSGPGIPEEFQDRMYEEFTQASGGERRTAGGYGLGLAIVRYLMRALGGTVTYQRAASGGAEFVLDLPAGPADPDGVLPSVRDQSAFS
ncbi:hypothetical protein BH24ACT15_BH24ACT15_00380 [soil metagenome]